jgi:hypothetical protein
MKTLSPVRVNHPESIFAELKILHTKSEKVVTLIEILLSCKPEQPAINFSDAYWVQLALLSKIANDIKAMISLSSQGLTVQLCTLASSVMETVFTSLDILANEQNATVWSEHNEEKTTYGGNVSHFRNQTIERLFQRISDIDVATVKEKAEKKYKFLCQFKHGNPIVLRQISFERDGNSQFPVIGSHTSTTAKKWQLETFEYVIYLSNLAMVYFVFHHLNDSTEVDPQIPQMLIDVIIDMNKQDSQVLRNTQV